MSDYQTLQNQIDALQEKMAFQDDTIEQLNAIVTQQDIIISKMEHRFTVLGSKLQDMESNMPNKSFDPADEVPPHF